LGLPLTGYRTVAGSLSKQAAAMEAGMKRILHKLDARKAWNGRWLLRRKAYSYCEYSCAYMYREAGYPARALQGLLSSLAWYPFPYRRSEVRMPLARPKTFVMLLSHLLKRGRGGNPATGRSGQPCEPDSAAVPEMGCMP